MQIMNDTVILYRLNAQSRIMDDTLLRNAIPYKVLGGLTSVIMIVQEIKDISSYLRLIVNTNDDIALRRVINQPKRGIGNTTFERVRSVSVRNALSMFEVCERADEFDEFNSSASAKLQKVFRTYK